MDGRKECIFLDPTEVAIEGRTEINLHEGAILVGEEGPDWGDYEVEQFLAKREIGATPIDETIPNRIITIPLMLGATGDFDAARISLEAWASDVNHRGGGWLKRELIGGSYGEAGEKLYADVIKVSLHLGGGTAQATRGIDPDAHLTLEALPDFYGDSIELPSFTGTGAASQLVKTKGTLPGRVDFTVSETSGNDQCGLGWAFRCLNYSEAATAQWEYQAEALTPLDAAAVTALTGASGTTVRHNSLSTEWTPVLSTNLKAGTYLTHKGIYDLWARVYTTSLEAPWLRFIYDVGDMVAPTENIQVQVPGRERFFLVNLGQVNLRAAPVGSHRWQGAIQARGVSGGENVYIDKLYFFCADESSGILSAPSLASTETGVSASLAGFKVRDEFDQTAGNATGKSLQVGGAWAGLGDPTDATIDAANHLLTRTAVSDESPGRVLYATGLEMGATVVQCDLKWSAATAGDPELGIVARLANLENFAAAKIQSLWAGGGSKPAVFFVTRIAGAEKFLGPYFIDATAGEWIRLKLVIYANGLYKVIAGRSNSALQTLLVSSNSALASAGILATGRVGIWDAHYEAAAVTRSFDNFLAWAPEIDAVAYANRNARLTSQGMFRQSGDGLGVGPVGNPGSDLPRIPCSGPNERPVEIVMKLSRGDFGLNPDAGLDSQKGQLSYRPCWAGVPGF